MSLPEDDVAFLDEYAARVGIETRSAAVHRAVQLLQASELGQAYESAWTEWEVDGEASLWESTRGDGLGNASR